MAERRSPAAGAGRAAKKAPAKKAPAKKAATKKAPAKKAAPGRGAEPGVRGSTAGQGRLPPPPPLRGSTPAAPARPERSVPEPAPPGRDRGVLPVRADETPWTAGEIEEIRAELTAELERINRQASALQTNIDDVLRDSGDGAGDDQADSGAKAFEREQEMALLARIRDTGVQTERALRRIADGTYGSCESCGSAIGKLRLQAFPRATLCVVCKQEQEGR